MLLQNDGSVIQLFVHKMYCAAGDLNSVSEGLFLSLKPRKCRQQGRMDVQNPLRKLLYEPGREQAHVPGETDEVNLALLQSCSDFLIVLLAGLALRWDE